ncbi:MAG: Rieske (2Fe-2S) protein [Candidatus Glassbacteria bacterium]|nr:Rieske (2Fe-2S) protein [Candidatus Glassbacteria bacterium]
MKRREVLKVLGSSAVLVTILPELASAKKLALGLDKAEQLKKVGGSAILKIKGQEILFIRECEEVIRALDPECKHRKCTVEYDNEQNLIVCPCHGSTYDTKGEVLKGPATESLTAFEATLSGDRIIFSLE